MDTSTFEKTITQRGLLLDDVVGSKCGDLAVRGIYRDNDHPHAKVQEQLVGFQLLWKGSVISCSQSSRSDAVPEDSESFSQALQVLITKISDSKIDIFVKDVITLPEDQLLVNMLLGNIVLYFDTNGLICHKDSAIKAVGYKVDKHGKETSTIVKQALATGMFYLTNLKGDIFAPKQPVDRRTLMVLSLTLGNVVTKVWTVHFPILG